MAVAADTCGMVIGAAGFSRCASAAISGGMIGIRAMNSIWLDRIMV